MLAAALFVGCTSFEPKEDRAFREQVPTVLAAAVILDSQLSSSPEPVKDEEQAVAAFHHHITSMVAPRKPSLRYLALRLTLLHESAADVAQFQGLAKDLYSGLFAFGRNTSTPKWIADQLGGLKQKKLEAYARFHENLYLAAAAERLVLGSNVLKDRLVILETMGGQVGLEKAVASVDQLMANEETIVRSEIAAYR